ncbi:hypothetical protein [Aureimonas sp. Leaf324]|uniref:hypothetical protein n=1 Tax=Aureimonas sp. Leaf324 TaxID=1736336 RepID=UPI0006F7E1FA|nr:hypothetical protein [Aureimonas sp. Leaf324]KQQ78992.1 hypothetical protein ASF65_14040 [Aureimonas sp. Leaf324]
MDILIFVDPDAHEQRLALEIAATVAEFCAVERRSASVLADEPTAVEIGIGLLGLIDPPTVEGGGRAGSTITLLPPIYRYDEDYVHADGEVPDNSFRTLLDAGVFARPADGDRTSKVAGDPLSDAIVEGQPLILLGLGLASEYWKTVQARLLDRSNTEVLLIDGLAPLLDDRILQKRLSQPRLSLAERRTFEDDRFHEAEREAYHDGQTVAGVIEFLRERFDRPARRRGG